MFLFLFFFCLKVMLKRINLETTGHFKDQSIDIGSYYKQIFKICKFSIVSNIYYLIKNNLITFYT